MTGAALRTYQLQLTPGPNQLSARVERTGPGSVLSLGIGQPLDKGIRLAGLLFPICPRAHQAAALNAAELAAGIDLPLGQRAGRDALVLAEAIAGCVWRSGLGWTKLLSIAPMTEPVKAARAASACLEGALFRGNWARAGGAQLSIDGPAATDALTTLTDSVHAVASLDIRLLTTAEKVLGATAFNACNALGDRIETLSVSPFDTIGEETPGPFVQVGTVLPKRCAERFSLFGAGLSGEASVQFPTALCASLRVMSGSTPNAGSEWITCPGPITRPAPVPPSCAARRRRGIARCLPPPVRPRRRLAHAWFPLRARARLIIFTVATATPLR